MMDKLTDDQLKIQLDELIDVGGQAVAQGLALASGGNLSVRISDDTLAVTGKGTWLNHLQREQFTVMNFNGGVISGPQPSSEWKLHSLMYAKRADARAIIHLHPQYALLLYALGKRIRFITQDHAFYVGSYGQTKYYTNGADEVGETAAAEVADGRHNVVLLGHHGIATLGESVESAFRRAVNFEEAAIMTYRALLLGDEDTIFPPDELDKLHHA
jgi:ribulose-5-phosphate 4-epimerase/fuculose-1-phosphate aldolase